MVPLYNPLNLLGIQEALQLLPDALQHTFTVNAADDEKAVWEAVAKLFQEPQRLAQPWADLNIVPISQNERLSLKHQRKQKPLEIILGRFVYP